MERYPIAWRSIPLGNFRSTCRQPSGSHTERGLTYSGDEILLEGMLDEWNVRSMTAVQALGEKLKG